MLKKSSSLRAIPQLTPEARGHVAENMKERIYSAITLMAVVTTLYMHSELHTVRGVVVSIFGSVVALWLATLVATRISYRAVYAKEMTVREYRSTMFATSGLLAPALLPTVLVLMSQVGVWNLKDALVMSLVVLLGSIFYFSFLASRKLYEKPWQILLVSAIELAIGGLVIGLKLALG